MIATKTHQLNQDKKTANSQQTTTENLLEHDTFSFRDTVYHRHVKI